MEHNFGHLALRYDLDRAIDILCSSYGYQRSDKYLRKLMRVGLKLQHRLDRHLVFGSRKDNYKYFRTRDFLTSINCHGAAYCVENQISFRNRPKPTPTSFFRTDYSAHSLTDFLQARHQVLRKPFPSIVQIASDHLGEIVIHSCIALDETPNRKDIYMWEKKGTVFSFRITTLDKVFEYYTSEGHERYWAVRPLQTPLS